MMKSFTTVRYHKYSLFKRIDHKFPPSISSNKTVISAIQKHCNNNNNSISISISSVSAESTRPSFQKRQLVTMSMTSAMEEKSAKIMEEEIVKRGVFDVESAEKLVKDLKKTFYTGKTKSYEWRRDQLKSVIRMIEENENDIYEALRNDLSKPEMETFISEISMTKNAAKFALKGLKKWMQPEKAGVSMTTFPSKAEIVSEPLGVVLVISAWNYPVLLSLDPVIGAIGAGNAVVLKPSEISPASSALLARLVEKYLDNSTIRVVEGAVKETTALLEQKWDKILYTGNGRIARIVMAAAAKHLTPVVLELGGKSPCVVDSDVNLMVAVRRIVAGKWGANNGQACISPDYIITTKAFAPELIEALKCILVEFFGKEPLESKELSCIVNSNHFARLSKLVDEVSDKVVLGGERDEKRLQIAPTILLDVPQDSQIMMEEIFGPLLPIVTVDHIEEAFDIVRSRSKPLAAYLFSNNKKLEKEFVSTISSGGMLINDCTIHLANSNLPFGGVGDSGTGSYHGKFSFDAFSHKKAVLYRGFGGESSARYPPFTPKKQKILRALLNGDIFGVLLALLGW